MPMPSNPRDFIPDGMLGDYRQWHKPDIRDQLAEHLGEITRLAGGLILEAVSRGFKVYQKPDGSSYTDADIAAERYILDALAVHFPYVPVIAEEQTAARAGNSDISSPGSVFFLVDPLDGTRDFTTGGLDYTVNIAAIVDGAPIAGAVYAPASGLLWIGGAHAFTIKRASSQPRPTMADWRAIHTRKAPSNGLIALSSRRHGTEKTEGFLAHLPIRKRYSISSSVKFCLIAQGEVDVYPRFEPTMEWDTAAGDAILRAAGGIVVDTAGASLTYGRVNNNYVNGPFIAWGDATNIDALCC